MSFEKGIHVSFIVKLDTMTSLKDLLGNSMRKNRVNASHKEGLPYWICQRGFPQVGFRGDSPKCLLKETFLKHVYSIVFLWSIYKKCSPEGVYTMALHNWITRVTQHLGEVNARMLSPRWIPVHPMLKTSGLRAQAPRIILHLTKNGFETWESQSDPTIRD